MGIGPAFAIPEVLEKAKLKLSDIELIEINEAFAAQVISVKRQLEANNIGKINRDILNVNGGAIALGHPVGTTGSRLILTLLKEMKRRNLHLGLVSLCVGGAGGGIGFRKISMNLKLRIENEFAVIEFDQPNSKVNVLS